MAFDTGTETGRGTGGETGAGRETGAIDSMPATASAERLDRELAGLDSLESVTPSGRGLAARVWSACWPMLGAIAIAIGLWELVVLSGWKEPWVLPGPRAVLPEMVDLVTDGSFWAAVGLTMRRAVTGFAISIVIGVLVGAAVSRSRVLRRAFGSLITGLQTMPSIAWFPLAILLFQLSESAIMFVVVLGATPSIANGLINGIDYTPPILLRAGKVMGLRGLALYRHLIMPASLPAFVAGLKQGWAFAWRSLMAGELLVIIGDTQSVGTFLHYSRELSATERMISVMIVILVIGILVDRLFALADRSLRRRWGMDTDTD